MDTNFDEFSIIRKKPANNSNTYGIIPIMITPILICAKNIIKKSNVPSCTKLMITAEVKNLWTKRAMVANGKTFLWVNSVGSVKNMMISKKLP